MNINKPQRPVAFYSSILTVKLLTVALFMGVGLNTAYANEALSFEHFCAKEATTTQHQISLGQVTRVSLHADSKLQVVESIGEADGNIQSVRALFNRELSKLALPTQCIEYLLHSSKLAQSVDKTVARVYFSFNQSTLTNESQSILKRLVDLVNASDTAITIEGHTDSTGTKEYNLALGLRRALSTEDFLAEQGISPAKMTSKSFGEKQKTADNKTRKGRELNRRVEVKTTASK